MSFRKVSQKISEDELDVLHLIQEDSTISQRALASKSGLSLGKVNYCLKSLVDIGFIKIKRFGKSKKKLNYAYILTPKGFQEKIAITKAFISKKQSEYDKLSSYLNNKTNS